MDKRRRQNLKGRGTVPFLRGQKGDSPRGFGTACRWRFERLEGRHERQRFDCGKPPLNDFIRSLVGQYERRNLGRTYVAVAPGEERVRGYYTLAGGAIAASGLPAQDAKKLPRHPVPIVLLARLAVDQGDQGQGLGAWLLKDALTRSLAISESLGIHAVVVDAMDEDAKTFYRKYGFLELTDHPMRLCLPVAALRAAANQP